MAGILYLIEWTTGRDMSRAFSRRYRYIERMGKTLGTIWHIVSYVILPHRGWIGVGLVALGLVVLDGTVHIFVVTPDLSAMSHTALWSSIDRSIGSRATSTTL